MRKNYCADVKDPTICDLRTFRMNSPYKNEKMRRHCPVSKLCEN